jgi:PAS domain S-box-containing protein
MANGSKTELTMGMRSSSSKDGSKSIEILSGELTRQERWILRYGAALVATGLALLLRKVFDPILGSHSQYLTIFPAVIFSAWYCGVGPSVLATLAAFFGEKYWFLEPRGSLAVADVGQIISAVIYLLAAAFIITLTEMNRRAMAEASGNLREAHEAQNLLRAFMDHNPAATYMKDEQGKYVYCNRTFQERFQMKDDLLGKTDAELKLTKEHHADDLEVLAQNKSLEFIENGPQQDTWLSFKFPFVNESGKIFVGAVSMDITERKRFEEELRQAREHLESQVQQRTRELEQRNAELVKQADVVRELSGRLLQMRDEERRHIARELHDGLGQIIAAMHMTLSRISAKPEKLPPEVAKAAAETTALTEQLSKEVRTLSHLLYPPLLDELGLESALRWYVQGFAERSKIKVAVEIPPNLGRLPRDLEMHIFRIVQECLTNIHRHSGSPTAVIRLKQDADRVRLEVKDAGRGIPPEKLAAFKSGGKLGVGIRGMRERVRQFGGNLEIESSESGTCVTVELPLANITATAVEESTSSKAAAGSTASSESSVSSASAR